MLCGGCAPGVTARVSGSAGSGTATLAVVAPVSNLTPGLTYHFRLVASSSLGTTRGADATFATIGPPSVATGPITLATLSLSSVQVNGTVNPRSLETTWWFEYGRTRGYGFRTVEQRVTGTASGVAHFAHLGGMLGGWLMLQSRRGGFPFR